MNLMAMQMADNLRKLKTTVLRREGGTWQDAEVDMLVANVMTVITQHPQHPEYLILFGHRADHPAVKSLVSAKGCTAIDLVGSKNEGLPFTPSF